MLVAVYALYVVVAATYDSILAKLGAAPPIPEGAKLERRSSLIYEDEPAANSRRQCRPKKSTARTAACRTHSTRTRTSRSAPGSRCRTRWRRRRRPSSGRSTRSRHLIDRFGLLRFARDEAHFGDVEDEDGTFGCYVFKANKFYLSCRASTTPGNCVGSASRRARSVSTGKKRRRREALLDAERAVEVCVTRRGRGRRAAPRPRAGPGADLPVVGAPTPSVRSFDDVSELVAMRAFMLAPNGAVFDAALERLTAAADAACQVVPLRRQASVFVDGHAPTDEMEPSLIEWPEDAACLGVALHVALLPIKWLLHATITDVRTDPGLAKDQAPAACLECVAWLVVLSLAMVWCCEALGALLGLPDSVVGLTLSAVGTSLPNLFASISVAKKGPREHGRVERARVEQLQYLHWPGPAVADLHGGHRPVPLARPATSSAPCSSSWSRWSGSSSSSRARATPVRPRRRVPGPVPGFLVWAVAMGE